MFVWTGDGRQLDGVRDRRGGLIKLVSRFRTGKQKEVTTLAPVKINETDSRVGYRQIGKEIASGLVRGTYFVQMSKSLYFFPPGLVSTVGWVSCVSIRLPYAITKTRESRISRFASSNPLRRRYGPPIQHRRPHAFLYPLCIALGKKKRKHVVAQLWRSAKLTLMGKRRGEIVS